VAGRKRAYRSTYGRTFRRAIRAGQEEIAVGPVSRSCGDLANEGAGTYGVASVNVICDIALQVARQWELECATAPSGDCTVNAGFACDYTQVALELGNITCTQDDRTVTFETGA